MLYSLSLVIICLATMKFTDSQLPTGNCLSVSCGGAPYIKLSSEIDCKSAQKTKSNEYRRCCKINIPPEKIECKYVNSKSYTIGG